MQLEKDWALGLSQEEEGKGIEESTSCNKQGKEEAKGTKSGRETERRKEVRKKGCN